MSKMGKWKTAKIVIWADVYEIVVIKKQAKKKTSCHQFNLFGYIVPLIFLQNATYSQ